MATASGAAPASAAEEHPPPTPSRRAAERNTNVPDRQKSSSPPRLPFVVEDQLGSTFHGKEKPDLLPIPEWGTSPCRGGEQTPAPGRQLLPCGARAFGAGGSDGGTTPGGNNEPLTGTSRETAASNPPWSNCLNFTSGEISPAVVPLTTDNRTNHVAASTSTAAPASTTAPTKSPWPGTEFEYFNSEKNRAATGGDEAAGRGMVVHFPDATRTTEQEEELTEAIGALLGGNDTERKAKVDIDALLSPNGGSLILDVGHSIPTLAPPRGGKEDQNAADHAKRSAEQWERYWFQDYSSPTTVELPSQVETPAAGASTPLAEAAESAVVASDAGKQKESLMWQAEAAACGVVVRNTSSELDEDHDPLRPTFPIGKNQLGPDRTPSPQLQRTSFATAGRTNGSPNLTVEKEGQDHSAPWANLPLAGPDTAGEAVGGQTLLDIRHGGRQHKDQRLKEWLKKRRCEPTHGVVDLRMLDDEWVERQISGECETKTNTNQQPLWYERRHAHRRGGSPVSSFIAEQSDYSYNMNTWCSPKQRWYGRRTSPKQVRQVAAAKLEAQVLEQTSSEAAAWPSPAATAQQEVEAAPEQEAAKAEGMKKCKTVARVDSKSTEEDSQELSAESGAGSAGPPHKHSDTKHNESTKAVDNLVDGAGAAARNAVTLTTSGERSSTSGKENSSRRVSAPLSFLGIDIIHDCSESPYGKAKTGPAGGDGFFKLYKVSSFSSDLDNEYDHITEEQMTEWAKDYKLDQGAAEKWARMDIEDKQRIVAHGPIQGDNASASLMARVAQLNAKKRVKYGKGPRMPEAGWKGKGPYGKGFGGKGWNLPIGYKAGGQSHGGWSGYGDYGGSEFAADEVPVLKLKNIPYHVNSDMISDWFGVHARNIAGKINIDRAHQVAQVEFRNLGMCYAAKSAKEAAPLKGHMIDIVGPLRIHPDSIQGATSASELKEFMEEMNQKGEKLDQSNIDALQAKYDEWKKSRGPSIVPKIGKSGMPVPDFMSPPARPTKFGGGTFDDEHGVQWSKGKGAKFYREEDRSWREWEMRKNAIGKASGSGKDWYGKGGKGWGDEEDDGGKGQGDHWGGKNSWGTSSKGKGGKHSAWGKGNDSDNWAGASSSMDGFGGGASGSLPTGYRAEPPRATAVAGQQAGNILAAALQQGLAAQEQVRQQQQQAATTQQLLGLLSGTGGGGDTNAGNNNWNAGINAGSALGNLLGNGAAPAANNGGGHGGNDWLGGLLGGNDNGNNATSGASPPNGNDAWLSSLLGGTSDSKQTNSFNNGNWNNNFQNQPQQNNWNQSSGGNDADELMRQLLG